MIISAAVTFANSYSTAAAAALAAQLSGAAWRASHDIG